MPNPNFKPVITDNLTLDGYVHDGGEFRLPTHMAEVVDGGELIRFKGAAYRIDERGNLINERVEMPQVLTIGYGVFIGAGVEFRPDKQTDDSVGPETILNSGSTIYDPEARRQVITEGLVLGKNSVVRAAFVGSQVQIGSESSVLSGARIGDQVFIGELTDIGRKAIVGNHDYLGDTVTVGFKAVLGSYITVGDRVKINPEANLKGNTMLGEGVVIARGQIVGKGVTLPDNFNAENGLEGGREILDFESYLGSRDKVLPPAPRK